MDEADSSIVSAQGSLLLQYKQVQALLSFFLQTLPGRVLQNSAELQVADLLEAATKSTSDVACCRCLRALLKVMLSQLMITGRYIKWPFKGPYLTFLRILHQLCLSQILKPNHS